MREVTGRLGRGVRRGRRQDWIMEDGLGNSRCGSRPSREGRDFGVGRGPRVL